MNRRSLVAALAAGVLALGCASAPVPTDYAAEKPVLALEKYFDGELVAHGLFTDRGGKVVRRFTVLMKCSWTGDDGVLDEDFTYSDGKKERRIWRLKKLRGPGNEGRYTGTADDVVGTAQGQASGNAFRWAYTLRLPVDGSVYEVQFDDWMYLVDERVMLNKAVMSKFGIRLGEVTLAFTKKP
ncbi:DUF3833 domain-containing protein [Rhizobacter sp. AJA081-3]|uniref:DUF3833 domain-containing protein n=1 Tax=Rhizobacter sp. AJA081-3 TaxID=2753607 RepID=UPI001AE0178C|nr:DUF3833 domain-containing protein [Rhizobacter sp. AJA081-3]QTN22710.1 DUF3833 domain-containing protein [Rhizobacter sp. AJA081-3]